MFQNIRFLLLTLILSVSFPSWSQNLSFQPDYFDKGSAKLSKPIKESLKRVAQLLESNPEVTLKLEAYAGAKESTEGADALSKLRAKAAYDHLIKQLKVPASRLSFEGMGSKGLIAPNDLTASDNKRIEFIFTSSKASKDVAGDEIEVLYWNTLYHSLYQIGEEKGYFAKEGFKLKLVATNHSKINQVNAVCGIEPFLKERVTVFTGAVCGGSPHYAAAHGIPLVVIGGMMVGGSMLIAMPEMAAKLKADWKNFKGITIGRPAGTFITSMIISDALKKRGIDPKKDITWKIFDSHEAVVEAIAKGKIDAGDTYVPLNLRANKEHGIVEVYNTVKLFPFHPCCRVITTQDKLKTHRAEYVKFMRAVIKSHEYFVKQPRDAWKIIQKYTGYTDEEVKTSLSSPSFQLNPDPLKNGFVKFWKMMNDTGFVDSDADINQFIDTSIYKDALDSLAAEDPKNAYYIYMQKQFIQQNPVETPKKKADNKPLA